MGGVPYSQEEIKQFKEIIIQKLSEGKSLNKILKSKDLPSRPYVYEWLNPEHERYDLEFANNYAHAREEQADMNAEQIEEIAQKTLKGKYEPNAARVAIDALKWAAGKKKPKKYGHKVDVTSGGKEVFQQVAIFELPDNGRGDNAQPEEEENE